MVSAARYASSALLMARLLSPAAALILKGHSFTPLASFLLPSLIPRNSILFLLSLEAIAMMSFTVKSGAHLLFNSERLRQCRRSPPHLPSSQGTGRACWRTTLDNWVKWSFICFEKNKW